MLYGLFHDTKGPKGLNETLALVVLREEARIVRLGKASDVEAACTTLARAVGGGGAADRGADLSESEPLEADWGVALQTAKKHLVEPLKLRPSVQRVLVSPDGLLSYVPFAALLDRPVVMTPSGTTHVVLQDEQRSVARRGRGILALGDPDYTGQRYTPLGATRTEVERIVEPRAGDGAETKVLLGAMASETALRAALEVPRRWRAIHLACHGVINRGQPMFSALALSRARKDSGDGSLTAQEIMMMRMNTDLAVLSACQSSRGRIAKGEGIVGFTRALMFAGASQVLCSLWNVDDRATSELMIKFYDSWQPTDGSAGVSADVALRKAQAHVRAMPKWEHPRYWAAWTLWGLPGS